MERKFTLLALTLTLISSSAFSASIGAAPGTIEFGEVEKGETITQEIYLTTTFEDEFQVNPSFSSAGNQEMFEGQNKFETSEEDITSWVELESAEVSSNRSKEFQLSDGSKVNSNGEFTMRVEIPRDAEPGYHHGMIRLNPSITSNEEGSPGALTWGETVVHFRFKVEGDAERLLTVQDVRGFRLQEDSAAVEVLLRNSGTVTTSTEGFSFDVYDQRRNQITSLYANGETLAPGESAWVAAQWNEEDRIEQGVYQIDGEVDYITGSATASGRFSLPDYNVVEVRPEDSPGSSEEEDSLPMWLVLIVLLLLGVLMWGFDIQPFWILLVVGVLGISAVIFLTGVSNLLILILLIVVGIVAYGGM